MWPFKKKQKMKRGKCPICKRDVAITKNGLTYYHRQFPGAANSSHHSVRMSDGKEI